MKRILLFLALSIHFFAQAEISIHMPSLELDIPTNTKVLWEREVKFSKQEIPLIEDVNLMISQQKYQDMWVYLQEKQIAEPSAAWLHLRAQAALMLEKNNAAENLLKQALKLAPHFVRAHQTLALICLRQEHYAQAQKHLITAIEQGANQARTYGLLGYLYQKQAQHAQAISAYQQAYMLEPTQDKWAKGLLQSYLAISAYDQALALLPPLLEAHPNDVHLWKTKSFLSLKMNKPEQALASLNIAYQLQPQQEIAWQLAQLYFQQSYYQQATQYFLLSAKNTLPHFKRYMQTVSYLIEVRQHKHAQSMLQIAIKKQQQLSVLEQAELTYLRGKYAYSKKKVSQARQFFKQALHLSPLHAESMYDLAKIYIDQKKYNQADTLLIRAEHIPRMMIHALSQRVYLAMLQHQYPKALDLLKKWEKKDPDNKNIKLRIQNIQRIEYNRTA